MKYANALLARLGLNSKDDAPDAFDLRLRRIEAREAQCNAQLNLFRIQQTRQAA